MTRILIIDAGMFSAAAAIAQVMKELGVEFALATEQITAAARAFDLCPVVAPFKAAPAPHQHFGSVRPYLKKTKGRA